MIIRHAILHILDKDAGNLIASQHEMDINNLPIHEYLEGIITKFQTGDHRPGQLNDGDMLAQLLQEESGSFVERTTILADKLFAIIAASEAVPTGDLLCVEYADGTDDYFVALKLNLVPRYTHTVEYKDDELMNQVVLNRSVLPDPTQRAQEGIIVNLMDGTYQLVDKQYLIDGHRVTYFSERFLELDPEKAPKDQLKTIKQSVKTVANNFAMPEYEALSNAQAAIFEQVQSNDGAINTAEIADAVFSGNISAKQAYEKLTTEKALDATIDVPNAAQYEKKYQTQRFKLDSGIEITIPMDVYQDRSKVEFVQQPDGSMSLMIKSIDEIINKFNI